MWFLKGLLGAFIGLFIGIGGAIDHVNNNQDSKGLERDRVPFVILIGSILICAVLGSTRSPKLKVAFAVLVGLKSIRPIRQHGQKADLGRL